MALSGAIYTSNFDGSDHQREHRFRRKVGRLPDGGPCNGGSHLGNGDYYFEVTSPNGVLLSSDSIGTRFFTVDSGLHPVDDLARDARRELLAPVTGVTVQLIPYDDTPNSGNEYKLTIATASSVQAAPASRPRARRSRSATRLTSKTDNFKVGPPTLAPRPRRPSPRRATPTVAPTATPTAARPPPAATPDPDPARVPDHRG